MSSDSRPRNMRETDEQAGSYTLGTPDGSDAAEGRSAPSGRGGGRVDRDRLRQLADNAPLRDAAHLIAAVPALLDELDAAEAECQRLRDENERLTIAKDAHTTHSQSLRAERDSLQVDNSVQFDRAEAAEAECQRLRDENDGLRRGIEGMRSTLNAAGDAERDALRDENERLTIAKEAHTTHSQSMRAERDALRVQLAEAQQRIAAVEALCQQANRTPPSEAVQISGQVDADEFLAALSAAPQDEPKHDPRCISLTDDPEVNCYCDCRTLRMIDDHNDALAAAGKCVHGMTEIHSYYFDSDGQTMCFGPDGAWLSRPEPKDGER